MSTERISLSQPDAKAPAARANGQADVLQAARLSKALFERHLQFDKVVNAAGATPHERFEAFALSVREVLAQRWVETKSTYATREPQAGLLPVHGVSDRPLARQQCDQPAVGI